MGGGDLNTKKSWHPNTIKNQERVWKAEQAVAEEKKRILELQRERELEHDRAQLNDMAQRNFGAAGSQSADNRLHWMYDKPDKQAHHEDYLLGKEIGKSEASEKSQNAIPAVSRRVVGSSMTKSLDDTQVDLTRKLREDPLLLVKERERAARAALLNNPLQRKRLAELLRKEKEQNEGKQKESKTKKKLKKKNKNLDDMLAAKLNALGDKGIDLSSLLNSNDSSDSSESDNEKPKKKKRKKDKGKKKKKNKKSSDSEPDSSEDKKHRRKQGNERDSYKSISRKQNSNNSSGPPKPDDRKSMKSYESHHKDHRSQDVDRKNYQRSYDNSKHQSASRYNEIRKLSSRSPSHSDGETKYKKSISEHTDRNRKESDKCKRHDSLERRDARSHDVDRKNYDRSYDSRHQRSSRHNEPRKRPSRSSSHSDGETKYKKRKSEYTDRNESDKYKRRDSPERRDKREESVGKKDVREKRQGMSEAERAAKLAEMAAAGRERETERGMRVARQRAEEAAVEADRGPPRALNNEARTLPDSLESRIRSNRHYIQRDKTHMNQNFARRPIRQIRIEKEHPRWVSHRSHYNGAWETTIIRDARTRAFNEMPLNPGEFFLPDQCYKDDLAISKEKFKDLQDLSKFCSHRAAEYFKNLKHT